MSIADKLTTIAENQQRVYDAGFSAGQNSGGGGYDQGFEAGKQAGYDAFWDVIQQNGARTDYGYAFAQTNHTKQTFKPKYNIAPVGVTDYLFYNIWVDSEEKQIDMSELEKELGIVFDFSQITRFRFGFYTNLFKSIGVVDLTNATTASALQYCFYAYGHTGANDPKLQKIEKIISSENTGWTNNSFANLVGLTEVRFEGVIGLAFNIAHSHLLSDESVQSIIDHLKDLSGATAQTLTFHATVGEKLTDAQKNAISAKNWTLVY